MGGLTAAILDKDIHVTDALQTLFAIRHPHVQFVFCDGTSLFVKADPGYLEKAKSDFATLVAFDVGEFPQHADFCRDPTACLAATLDLARTEDQTQIEYQKKLLPLIYGNIKPSFAEAFLVFEDTSRALLATL